MIVFRYLYFFLRGAEFRLSRFFSSLLGRLLLKLEGATYGKGIRINGLPLIRVSRKGGVLTIGNNFSMNSGMRHNQIGRQQKCMLVVGSGARLVIGNHVGMSSTAIVCNSSVTIGDHVKFGGNVVIYDTDFHSLDFRKRSAIPEDRSDVGKRPVSIGDHVFIGAHSTILKGVAIGSNSVIAAGSVVVKQVPPNEVWGGNPAKFIKRLDTVYKSIDHE